MCLKRRVRSKGKDLVQWREGQRRGERWAQEPSPTLCCVSTAIWVCCQLRVKWSLLNERARGRMLGKAFRSHTFLCRESKDETLETRGFSESDITNQWQLLPARPASESFPAQSWGSLSEETHLPFLPTSWADKWTKMCGKRTNWLAQFAE